MPRKLKTFDGLAKDLVKHWQRAKKRQEILTCRCAVLPDDMS